MINEAIHLLMLWLVLSLLMGAPVLLWMIYEAIRDRQGGKFELLPLDPDREEELREIRRRHWKEDRLEL